MYMVEREYEPVLSYALNHPGGYRVEVTLQLRLEDVMDIVWKKKDIP